MQPPRTTFNDREINSRFNDIILSPRVLSVRLVRCDDQAYNRNIDETDHLYNCRSFQIGSRVVPLPSNVICGVQACNENTKQEFVDDQVLNGTIKEEIIEETDHYNDNQLLQKGKTFLEPKYLYSEEYKEVTIAQSNGSNLLSIRCLLDDQCIQLSEENALRLIHVMDDIQEIIKIKVTETRPKVLLEACEICKFLGTSMPFPKDSELCHLEYYLLHINLA